MFMLFLLVILVVGFVVSLLVRRHQRTAGRSSAAATWSALGLGVLVVVVAFVSMTAIVPTREIGVVTSFGRPVDVLSNGLHLKAPWQKVNKLDGTIQTDNFTGSDRAIDIRIGNGSTSGVDATIRWRIRLDAGKELYQDYRQMENIRDSLVTRELKAALNEVLGDYDPLESVKAGVGSDGATTSAGVDLNAYSEQVHEALSERVGEDVEVLSVILPIIRFDQQTQEKINAYQAEVANTRIAEQREATAKAQAQANKNLAGSVSRDPNVLVSKCLDTLEEMVKAGQEVPIGFSCWPGSNGASVVLPQAPRADADRS